MKSLGRTLLIFGIGSIALGFMDMQFILLSRVDLWGPTAGWGIKGALTVAGAILWFLGNKAPASKSA